MRKKQNIMETHGKIESFEPTTLEQIWGFNESAKFGTTDKDEFKRQLDEMNRTEMEDLSRKIGVVIVESTLRLKQNLLREFDNYFNSLKRPIQPKQRKTISSLDKKALSVLAEGR